MEARAGSAPGPGWACFQSCAAGRSCSLTVLPRCRTRVTTSGTRTSGPERRRVATYPNSSSSGRRKQVRLTGTLLSASSGVVPQHRRTAAGMADPPQVPRCPPPAPRTIPAARPAVNPLSIRLVLGGTRAPLEPDVGMEVLTTDAETIKQMSNF